MGNTSCCCSSSLSQVDYQQLISKIDAVKEMSQIDEVISCIDELLNDIDEDRQVAKTDLGSSIKSDGGLREKVLKSSRSMRKGSIKSLGLVLSFAEQLKWVGVALTFIPLDQDNAVVNLTNRVIGDVQLVGLVLAVVGFVWERIEQVSSNREECIKLLRCMYDLAKYIKQLNERLQDKLKDKLNGVLQFIVKGYLMCISQMKSYECYRFFAATVAAEDLRKFRTDIGRVYQELLLELAIIVPSVLPPSQGGSPQAGSMPSRSQRHSLIRQLLEDGTGNDLGDTMIERDASDIEDPGAT